MNDEDRDIKLAYNCVYVNSNYHRFNIVHKLVYSNDRSAKAVHEAARSIGMVIPAKHRHGIRAYNYFISQFRYYLSVTYFEHGHANLDNLELLSDKILLSYVNNANYESRLELQDRVKTTLLHTHLVPLDCFNQYHHYVANGTIYNHNQLTASDDHFVILPNTSTYVFKPQAVKEKEWSKFIAAK